MGGNCVTATCHAICVNAGGAIRADDFAAGAAPGVTQRVLGIEVAAGGSRRDRLAHHNFTGIYGATG
jgi:hypothetical protein